MLNVSETDSGLEGRLRRLESDFPLACADLGDAVVCYRGCGSGPAVVLLHGIGSGAASWMDCALALSPHARVIAWDAPGYGRSSRLLQERPRAPDYAQRLRRFLTSLGIERCLLVGHSLGTLMAAAYAAQFGKSVGKLLLLSPAQGYGSAEKHEAGEKVEQERLAALRELGVAGMAAKRADRLVSENAGEAARAWVRWNMAQLHAEGYTDAVRLLCGDAIENHQPVGIPAAVYCGDADVVTTPRESEALAARWALPFGLIKNAGHACHAECPEQVTALILKNINAVTIDR